MTSGVRPGGLPEFLSRPGVATVLGLLNRDGEEARVVGGAVRNHLMGLPLADIDIATTALPDVVLARAGEAGIHAVPTGYEHGTVTLVVGGIPHEVTTLREDVETDGRRAVVRFGRDFATDAFRRDFTINALSITGDGVVHDYATGLADLAARRVRFIGDADQRIAEDYLRILRFFRFSAAYSGGTLDAPGLAAAIRHGTGLASLSRERVRQETMKLLTAPDAVPVLRQMADNGFLAPVLAGPGDVAALDTLAGLELRFGRAADAVLRLAVLGIATRADLARVREALRLTNREVARLELLLKGRAMLSAGHDERIYKTMIHTLGASALCDGALDAAAHGGPDPAAALVLAEHWRAPEFVLSGADVMALGVPRGPEIGRLLKAAEARWLAEGMPEGASAQHRLLAEVAGQGA